MSRCLLPGTSPLAPSIGPRGARRVCVQDPDGILVELFEDHSLDDRASAANGLPSIVSVTVSVQDLDAAYDFWVDALGFSAVADTVLHDPQHEALWRLDDAARDSLLLDAGSLVIELVEYRGPRGRRRPAGYLISDQGILNVAVGFNDKHEFECAYNRAVERGFRGHTEPWTAPGIATVVYLSDAEGLSVELLHVERSAFQYMGFIANQPSFAA
jgi:catechol 2,3-dioxygenase-like lactoylglutathione lyase family enzyme